MRNNVIDTIKTEETLIKTRQRKSWKEQSFDTIGKSNLLESKLGSAPMPTLCVVPDGIVSAKTDPVRNRPVLPHFLR
uniref:Uncharacterized protein n=1 Tax=Noccaea caerulescens TaxID=107243 RepID=A0A1J3K7H7_NOCCA